MTQPDRTAQDVQGMSDEEAFRRWAGDGAFMPSHPYLSGQAASIAKMAFHAALRYERARVSAICDKIEALCNQADDYEYVYEYVWEMADDVRALVKEIRNGKA